MSYYPQKLTPEIILLLLFSHSVVSDSLWPHGLQHARLLRPSPSPRVCSNTCPLSHWCYITISSSATLFYFCLLSFPVSGSFPMSRHFASAGQNIGASALTSVLPMNIQDWFPLGEGNGNPLQYSCLENPMDSGGWRATVHSVAKSWTRLSMQEHILDRM